jgi:3-dehydroquinate dehydratase
MQNSPTYKTITEADFDKLTEIFNSKPDYIEVDLNLVKKYSLTINNPKNKPKKKKNLLLEMEKKKELPKLNLNLKDNSTKVIVSYSSDKSTNYRNLRKIVKAMKGFNCDIMKFAVNPQNDQQNIDLVRLLVSKVKNDKFIIEVQFEYAEFWKVNGEGLGNLKAN